LDLEEAGNKLSNLVEYVPELNALIIFLLDSDLSLLIEIFALILSLPPGIFQ
jgi:hypothetical protein